MGVVLKLVKIKYARHVNTWAHKHARDVGKWARKHIKHVST